MNPPARLPVVDTHAHFWIEPPTTSTYALHAADAPVSAAELLQLMDAAGVVTLLQITRGFYGFDNSSSIAGAREHPGRYMVLGRFDSSAADPRQALRSWCEDPEIVGVRIFDHPVDEALFSRSRASFWDAVEELRLPVSIYVPGCSAQLARLADDHPSIPFVVDHAGLYVYSWMPPPERLEPWADVLSLAELPNVFIKASGISEATEEGHPYPRAQELVAELWATFGPRRLMWGSNYTPSHRVGSYEQHVEFARMAVEDRPVSEQKQFLHATACQVFGLSLPAEADE